MCHDGQHWKNEKGDALVTTQCCNLFFINFFFLPLFSLYLFLKLITVFPFLFTCLSSTKREEVLCGGL